MKINQKNIVTQNIKIKIPAGESDGGKNPFAVMCTVGFKMNVVILKGKKNNEASFCVSRYLKP